MCTANFPPGTEPPLNRFTDMCKNITFPQTSLPACRNAICKLFPNDNIDNIPSRKFPLEGETSKTSSDSRQTTEGTNSSEHDTDDNTESVDKATHDQPDLDQELACPIDDQDKLPDKMSEQVPDQLLDLKKSNSFLN